MRRPVLRSLVLASCLALGLGLAPTGCKKDMQALEIPSEGLELRYALTPGASFEGHIDRNQTLGAGEGQFRQVLKFGVSLQVLSVDEAGLARVAATVSGIQIDWNVPGMPMSLDEFNANAKKTLEGVTIRFNVDAQGHVSDVPAPPPELDEITVSVLDSVIEGLTSAFYVLPKEPLKADSKWSESDTRGREGKLGKYVEESTKGALVGLFQSEDGKQRLAQLRIDQDRNETTTTKTGASSTRVRSKVSVEFDVDADYITRIDNTQSSTQGPNTTTTKFVATWSRKAAGAQAPAGGTETDPNAGKQVQRIDDPCHDDYVGPNDCTDPCHTNYMGEEACTTPTPAPTPAPTPEAAPTPAPTPAPGT
jgi:hypothetical protein